MVEPFGMELSLDCYNCNPTIIRSRHKIQEFVDELVVLIKVKKFGNTVIVNFGEDPRVSGFSMTQLIETSLISGHFANQSNAVYLNIFSCKEFDHHKVEDFAKKFFEAETIQPLVNFRM